MLKLNKTMRKLIDLTHNQLKELFFSAPLFLQFIYIIRILWWGIGLLFFDFYFHVGELNHFNNLFMQLGLILFGTVGLCGLWLKRYDLSIIFALFNVFFLGMIAFTYVNVVPQSISGVSYAIDTLAAIWVLFRIQYDRAQRLRAKIFIQNSVDKHENFSSNPNKFE